MKRYHLYVVADDDLPERAKEWIFQRSKVWSLIQATDDETIVHYIAGKFESDVLADRASHNMQILKEFDA